MNNTNEKEREREKFTLMLNLKITEYIRSAIDIDNLEYI